MLSGDIRVNDIVIGEWTATKTTTTIDTFGDYECTMMYRAMDGYLYSVTWMVRGHAKGNGAISLAARVMQEGMVKIWEQEKRSK